MEVSFYLKNEQKIGKERTQKFRKYFNFYNTNLQIFIEFDLTIHIGIDFSKDFVQFFTRNVDVRSITLQVIKRKAKHKIFLINLLTIDGIFLS